MKIEIKKIVELSDVNKFYSLHLKRLLDYLQEAASAHSEKAGYGSRELTENGNAWVLNRIGINIVRYPAYGDELTITTWHKGANGFRAYRDFQIVCGDEIIVSATSLWIFIDLSRKRIIKVPEKICKNYTVEDDQAMELDIDQWRPDKKLTTEYSIIISTRPSDYDSLGHVNNAVYFDYLETLLDTSLVDTPPVNRIIVDYTREIQKGVSQVIAGLKQQDNKWVFKIESQDCVHASGECFFNSTI